MTEERLFVDVLDDWAERLRSGPLISEQRCKLASELLRATHQLRYLRAEVDRYKPVADFAEALFKIGALDQLTMGEVRFADVVARAIDDA